MPPAPCTHDGFAIAPWLHRQGALGRRQEPARQPWRLLRGLQAAERLQHLDLLYSARRWVLGCRLTVPPCAQHPAENVLVVHRAPHNCRLRCRRPLPRVHPEAGDWCWTDRCASPALLMSPALDVRACPTPLPWPQRRTGTCSSTKKSSLPAATGCLASSETAAPAPTPTSCWPCSASASPRWRHSASLAPAAPPACVSCRTRCRWPRATLMTCRCVSTTSGAWLPGSRAGLALLRTAAAAHRPSTAFRRVQRPPPLLLLQDGHAVPARAGRRLAVSRRLPAPHAVPGVRPALR